MGETLHSQFLFDRWRFNFCGFSLVCAAFGGFWRLWLFVSFGLFGFCTLSLVCRIVQHFLAKLTHSTLARQHPQHRFQHPPHVQPTSLASPTHRDGVKKIMIQTGGHFNPSFFFSSGGVGGGGSLPHDVGRSDDSSRGAIKSLQNVKKLAGGVGGAAAGPMMFQELMIQVGVQLNLCRQSKT